MSTSALPVSFPPAPRVLFFTRRSGTFASIGNEWHKMTLEDDARFATGYDRQTREPSIGIAITRRANGLMRVNFDLARLDMNLTPEVAEGLGQRWRDESVKKFSKSLYRAALRRAHFSKSFAQFEVAPDRVEEWKLELESVLSDPNTYEFI